MTTIGIVQGRLSPPVGGRLQHFPADTWREELPKAREAGLACIEWIYDADSEAQNPLGTDEGVWTIRDLSRQTGVGVWSICGDYFMARRLIRPDGGLNGEALDRLRWLIGRAAAVGARHIVLPFVDGSSLASPAERGALSRLLNEALPAADRAGVELHLETDLPSAVLAEVMARAAHARLRVTFDMGNSASLGFDPAEELAAVGRWVGSVHVKDRPRGGHSVPFGKGAVQFAACFRLLEEAGYAGTLILQAAREDGLDEVSLAIRNRRFVASCLTAKAAA